MAVKLDYQNGALYRIRDLNALTTVFWLANTSDARNQITNETLNNGLVTSRSTDAVTGWLKSIKTGLSGTTGVQDLAYEWDLVGNLKKRKDLNQSTLTEEFFYDNLYRLNYSTLTGVAGHTLDMAYDAMGNITTKSDVGTYTYFPSKKHQLASTSNGWTFGYDNNGNMTSGRGATITWTSFNYPASIMNGADTSSFSYTPDRRYWQQVSNYTSGGAATTVYAGGLLEKVTTTGGTDFRHMIPAGSSTIIVSRKSTGVNTINYVTGDHFGSGSAITNSAGGILVNSSFDAFGKRRGANWLGSPSAGDWTAIASTTRRGYTGHTMLDNLSLIHMNGRVQDPVIGRFASADPYITEPGLTQNYNRYSYVYDNPLSATDPSGFDYRWVEHPCPNAPNKSEPDTIPVTSCIALIWFPDPPRPPLIDHPESTPGTCPSQFVCLPQPKCASVGFNGAGGPNAGGNPDFTSFLKDVGAKEQPGNTLNFNNSSQAKTAAEQIQSAIKLDPNVQVMIYGYSRGGNSSVILARQLSASGIASTVITIDPHNMVGTLSLPSNANGLNFYQENPRSWTGGLAPWGQNPYNGSPVGGAENVKITDKTVNHLNIVSKVTANGSATRQKINALNAKCAQ